MKVKSSLRSEQCCLFSAYLFLFNLSQSCLGPFLFPGHTLVPCCISEVSTPGTDHATQAERSQPQ